MFNCYKYSLPFKKPFITGSGIFQHREGLILRFRLDQIDAISEAAPLPGFSPESLPRLRRAVYDHWQKIISFLSESFTLSELNQWVDSFPDGIPSLQFGLSTLGLNILSQRTGNSFAELLHKKIHLSLQINTIIGMGDSETTQYKIEKAVQSGFRVLKFKVPAAPGHLPDTLKKTAEKYPEIHFRLDPNQNWPINNIHELSQRFSGLPVEYIEEPCMWKSTDEYLEIINHCPLPVALDESIVKLGLQHVIDLSEQPEVLIIKPMLLGNILKIFETIGRQKALEKRMVFTTSLESAVGRKWIALAAGLIGNNDRAHGLDTGRFFRSDLSTGDNIKEGRLHLDASNRFTYLFDNLDKEKLEPVFDDDF